MATETRRMIGIVIAVSISAAPRSFLRSFVRIDAWLRCQLSVVSCQFRVPSSSFPVPVVPASIQLPAAAHSRLATGNWQLNLSSHQPGEDGAGGDGGPVR